MRIINFKTNKNHKTNSKKRLGSKKNLNQISLKNLNVNPRFWLNSSSTKIKQKTLKEKIQRV